LSAPSRKPPTTPDGCSLSTIQWGSPYASRRSPVIARNVVASSQPLAVQAGIKILQSGGNAVDAAIATAITLTVVEPNNNGLGSDAFAIVWDGKKAWGLNGSGKSPTNWNFAHFAQRQEIPELGWDSVTVPGAVSTWVALSQKFGNLPFQQLFESAIEYASNGFHLGPITAQGWQKCPERFADYPEFMAHFCPGSRAPEAGEKFIRKDLVSSLESIADSHGESFYSGDLAEQIIHHSRNTNGWFTEEDLAQHKPLWTPPVSQAYRHVNLLEIPPNGQGLAAQIGLALLAHFELTGPDSIETIHLQIECMKIAIRAAFDHFADPEAMRVDPETLLGEQVIKNAASKIKHKALDSPPALLPGSADTVYLSTADASGMMVSFIQSNYQGFGSGIVIPGTGISLQNRGRGFSLQADHPNAVAGGKRPFHTIIPGFVSEAGEARMSFGVMGGHMQHQGHLQMVSRIFDFQQNPQAAIDAPRWYLDTDYSLILEAGFSEKIAHELAKRGHRVSIVDDPPLFGGAQIIYKLDDGYCAGSDPRKEGQAAGF